MIIYKGDQYSLPIKIKTKDGETITPEQVDGVKINVNGVTEVYPDGALGFDAETSQWLYPLTQTETLGWSARHTIRPQDDKSQVVKAHRT